MKFLILPFIFLFPVTTYSSDLSWGLNDVTYIMPLPLDAKENRLLKLQSEGAKGVMIPEAMIMQLPQMDMQHKKDQINAMTRLMTVRIDNCFPLPTPQSCQKQIRMVWQPVIEKDRNITTVDAAFHSFYVLTEEEFSALTTDLKNWKKKYQKRESISTVSTDALDIHPYWKHERDESHALIEFNTLITKYAGQQNLTRVTVMVLRRMNDVWGFLGAEVKDGQLEVGAIPRLEGKTSQMFFNQLNDSKQYTGSMMSPAPMLPDSNLAPFIDRATSTAVFTEAEVIGNLQSSFAIENPVLFNPESMDCVNCHIAQSSREWLSAKLPTTIDQSLFSAFKYTNANYNLENKSTQVFNTAQLRGIGYFGQDLAISQRVINESAIVAEWLSAND